MKPRPLIILATIVVVVVGAAILFLNSQPPTVPLTKDKPRDPAVAAPTPYPPFAAPPGLVRGDKPAINPAASADPGKPQPEPMAEWEMKIDQVLRTNAGETETAQILINMLPTLPAEGQEEAAQHISNLIGDEDFNRVMPLVRNTSLPEEVHDVFVTDLMNRDDKVKLPALLEIAKLANHPHHEEALTDLEIFLDEDYGNNWSQWDAAMRAYLKKQADEEAESPAVLNPKRK